MKEIKKQIALTEGERFWGKKIGKKTTNLLREERHKGAKQTQAGLCCRIQRVAGRGLGLVVVAGEDGLGRRRCVVACL